MTKDFEKILHPLKQDDTVQRMKQYIQHGSTSTYRHSHNVAKACYLLNRRLHLRANERTLLTSAMLHDFYLYDWHHKDDGSHRWHGFHHASRAKENAVRIFHVDKDVQDAIDSHMWPLNPTKIPRSREAWILWVADKVVTLRETAKGRKRK